MAVSTATGTTDGTQRFDAWGNKTTVTGAAVATYGYTGREPDASGLTYYRARYYDPASRRFTQRDPIGYNEGDINLYGYVGNNPVNYTDPTGEFEVAGALGSVLLGGVIRGLSGEDIFDARAMPRMLCWAQWAQGSPARRAEFIMAFRLERKARPSMQNASAILGSGRVV